MLVSNWFLVFFVNSSLILLNEYPPLYIRGSSFSFFTLTFGDVITAANCLALTGSSMAATATFLMDFLTQKQQLPSHSGMPRSNFCSDHQSRMSCFSKSESSARYLKFSRSFNLFGSSALIPSHTLNGPSTWSATHLSNGLDFISRVQYGILTFGRLYLATICFHGFRSCFRSSRPTTSYELPFLYSGFTTTRRHVRSIFQWRTMLRMKSYVLSCSAPVSQNTYTTFQSLSLRSCSMRCTR